MFDELLPVLITTLFAVAAILFAIAANRVHEEVPDESRQYMDPLSLGLRLIWPLVNLVAHYIGERLSVEYLERIRSSLLRSGLSYLMSPEQFFGLQVVGALFFGILSWLLLDLAEVESGMVPFLLALLGFILPMISVKDRRKRREMAIVKALSNYLDFITMAVEAGLNLNGALLQAIDKGPEGPFKVELHRVMRDIKAGMARIDALRAMSERLDIREISILVSALTQAERSGASVGETLRIQADQRRVERFQRAEKLAMEAPVKLIFPLVAFIFPTTFVILGFPILMKFLYEL